MGNFHESRNAVRVLVADADPDTRSVYRQSLTLAGCDVMDAADGREALVKALSLRPTLVITETRLPIFNGYELCEVLRRDSVTRAVPILVLTTETRPSELDRARGAGADRVLVKPVTPDALLKEIQRLLQNLDQPADAATGQPSAGPVNDRRRGRLAKGYTRRETKTPPAEPPDLVCPSCDTPLIYEHSYVGGVSGRNPEQWDHYTCPAFCGAFEYRQRTRKLRRIVA